MKNFPVCLVILVSLSIWIAKADGRETEDPMDLIEAYRVWKLTDVLDLSEEEMPIFFSKLREIEDTEANLRHEERKAIGDIANLLGKEDFDEGALSGALERYEKIRIQRHEELLRMRKDAFSMLSVKQRCQFVVFEDRFRQEIRQMIGKVRGIRERQEMRRMEETGRSRQGAGSQRRSGRGRR